jgi:hypothetical protein
MHLNIYNPFFFKKKYAQLEVFSLEKENLSSAVMEVGKDLVREKETDGYVGKKKTEKKYLSPRIALDPERRDRTKAIANNNQTYIDLLGGNVAVDLIGLRVGIDLISLQFPPRNFSFLVIKSNQIGPSAKHQPIISPNRPVSPMFGPTLAARLS